MKTFKELFLENQQTNEGVKIYSWKGGLTLDGGYRSWTSDPNKAKHREFAKYEKEDPGYENEYLPRNPPRQYDPNVVRQDFLKKFIEKKSFTKMSIKQLYVLLGAFVNQKRSIKDVVNDLFKNKDNVFHSLFEYKGVFYQNTQYSGIYFIRYIDIPNNDDHIRIAYKLGQDHKFFKSDKIYTAWIDTETVAKEFGYHIETAEDFVKKGDIFKTTFSKFTHIRSKDDLGFIKITSVKKNEITAYVMDHDGEYDDINPIEPKVKKDLNFYAYILDQKEKSFRVCPNTFKGSAVKDFGEDKLKAIEKFILYR